MALASKLALQGCAFATVGGVVGYALAPVIPSSTAIEMTQALGNIGAIAGSLLGWSVGWLGQSRSLIKDIDYEAARQLFRDLGDTQRELIWRWGIALGCSICAIGCAVVLKTGSLSAVPFRWLFASASALLFASLLSVAYLFQRMLALAALKSQLDEFEHDELRKKRNRPPDAGQAGKTENS